MTTESRPIFVVETYKQILRFQSHLFKLSLQCHKQPNWNIVSNLQLRQWNNIFKLLFGCLTTNFELLLKGYLHSHCVKSVQILSFLLSVNYRIQTKKNSVIGHFSRSVTWDVNHWVFWSESHRESRKQVGSLNPGECL